jgi:hypothetical protein
MMRVSEGAFRPAYRNTMARKANPSKDNPARTGELPDMLDVAYSFHAEAAGRPGSGGSARSAWAGCAAARCAQTAPPPARFCPGHACPRCRGGPVIGEFGRCRACTCGAGSATRIERSRAVELLGCTRPRGSLLCKLLRHRCRARACTAGRLAHSRFCATHQCAARQKCRWETQDTAVVVVAAGALGGQVLCGACVCVQCQMRANAAGKTRCSSCASMTPLRSRVRRA